MVASLELGLSHEAGLVAVLTFFCLEIALFFTERAAPGILANHINRAPVCLHKRPGAFEGPRGSSGADHPDGAEKALLQVNGSTLCALLKSIEDPDKRALCINFVMEPKMDFIK